MSDKKKAAKTQDGEPANSGARSAMKGTKRRQIKLPERNGRGAWAEPRRDPISRDFSGFCAQRLVIAIIYFILKLLYRIRVVGRENITGRGPLIVLCNHQSYFDTPIMTYLIKPWPYMVAKRQLFRHFILRHLFYGFGSFPIDQDRLSLQSAKRIFTVLRRGDAIGIFPEGTRLIPEQEPGDVQAHPGAVYFARKTGAPLLLMSISRPLCLFRRTTVVISRPETPEELGAGYGEKPSDDLLTAIAMKKIYALQGKNYMIESDELRKAWEAGQ